MNWLIKKTRNVIEKKSFTQTWQVCHHLFNLMLFQTCMIFYFVKNKIILKKYLRVHCIQLNICL